VQLDRVRRDARDKQLGRPLRGHRDFVADVAFSPDGRILARP
jgi:hypothetical protein